MKTLPHEESALGGGASLKSDERVGLDLQLNHTLKAAPRQQIKLTAKQKAYIKELEQRYQASRLMTIAEHRRRLRQHCFDLRGVWPMTIPGEVTP